MAHLDGGETLVFEASGAEWMWALRRGTSLPLVFMQHGLFIAPHVCRRGLWGGSHVPMCAVLPPRLPFGFAIEKVASSYMCEEEEEEEMERELKLSVWIEKHKKIIIAEDSLNRVGGKIPYFETIPVFQIVKLTFSAAVASERGVINSFFLGVLSWYVSVFLAAFKVIMLAGCCPRGLLHLINLSWETGLPCRLLYCLQKLRKDH